jgi:hypothetical protein
VGSCVCLLVLVWTRRCVVLDQLASTSFRVPATRTDVVTRHWCVCACVYCVCVCGEQGKKENKADNHELSHVQTEDAG